MASVDEKFEFFCNYFYGQVRVINALTINTEAAQGPIQGHDQILFYKKVLLITHLDTLASIRYTEERYPRLYQKNKKRFIQFLLTSDVWPCGNMVSIPFLVEHTHNGKISNGRLKDFVIDKYTNNFEEGSFVCASVIDEPVEKLIKLSTTEQEEKVIVENRHYELLYRYRNYLVHESRVPGKSFEIDPEEKDPFYHGYVGSDKLFLAYPTSMFVGILERSITYVKGYLEENKMDPYDYVKETECW